MKSVFQIFVFFLLFYLGSVNALAQHWDSLLGGRFQDVRVMYVDTANNSLYVAGAYNEIGGKHIQGIARWTGSQWDSLGAGIDGLIYYSGSAYPDNTSSIVRYNKKLYVSGVFSSLGNVSVPGIGTWNGTAWDTLPVSVLPLENDYSGVKESGADLSDLVVINNKLYLGGDFVTLAGFPFIGIASWNDTSWSGLNFPNLLYFYGINRICEYNGSIYVTGGFSNTPNDSISNMLRWDGKNWLSVGGGIKGGLASITSMIVYNGELYVAGYFFQSDGNAGNYIQKWNGTTWSDVGGGTGGANGQIWNLLVFNGKLYAVGEFATAGGIPADEVATWDGTKWCGFGDTFNNTIVTECIYNDTLYVGGGFKNIDTYNIAYLAKWVGGNYVDSCSTVGINELSAVSEGVKVYPNPSDGKFTIEEQGVRDKEQVEVYNMLGEKIASSNSSEGGGINSLPSGGKGWAIDLQGQPGGIYLYRITSEKGEMIGSGKVVIE